MLIPMQASYIYMMVFLGVLLVVVQHQEMQVIAMSS